MLKTLTPAAFKAVISLSCDILPYVMTVDINSDIGTDNAIIHAKLRYKYSKIIHTSNPFPKKRSIARIRNCKNNTVVITPKDSKKGINDSFTRYLFNVFII